MGNCEPDAPPATGESKPKTLGSDCGDVPITYTELSSLARPLLLRLFGLALVTLAVP